MGLRAQASNVPQDVNTDPIVSKFGFISIISLVMEFNWKHTTFGRTMFFFCSGNAINCRVAREVSRLRCMTGNTPRMLSERLLTHGVFSPDFCSAKMKGWFCLQTFPKKAARCPENTANHSAQDSSRNNK